MNGIETALRKKGKKGFFKFAAVSKSLFEQRDLCLVHGVILFNNVKYLYN